MWSRIIFSLSLSSMSFQMYARLSIEKKHKEYVKIRLSIFLCPRKKKWTVGQQWQEYRQATIWHACWFPVYLNLWFKWLRRHYYYVFTVFSSSSKEKNPIYPSIFQVSSYVMSPINNIYIYIFSSFLTNYTDKKNADELFEARINLIMSLYSISGIRNTYASALSDIDRIRTTKIGKIY